MCLREHSTILLRKEGTFYIIVRKEGAACDGTFRILFRKEGAACDGTFRILFRKEGVSCEGTFGSALKIGKMCVREHSALYLGRCVWGNIPLYI